MPSAAPRKASLQTPHQPLGLLWTASEQLNVSGVMVLKTAPALEVRLPQSRAEQDNPRSPAADTPRVWLALLAARARLAHIL